MKAVIIAHGSLYDLEILKKECEGADFIICADGGAEFAKRSDINPDYLIGDFDSINAITLEHYKTSGTKIIRYPKEKDYTDTELCISKALELGCTEICLLAGVGGRLDHTMGNLGLLHIIKNSGAKGYIANDNCYVYLCTDEISLDGKIGDIVSIIPFKGEVHGVNLKGLKYPLENAQIEFGRPIGISNEMIETRCTINLSSGELLVIKTFTP